MRFKYIQDLPPETPPNGETPQAELPPPPLDASPQSFQQEAAESLEAKSQPPEDVFSFGAETAESAGEKPAENSYRIKGELEQANPEIEPLPPTPITDEAKDRLREWGLKDDQIGKIRELTSSFRYDLCEEKLERLTEHGGVVAGELPDMGEVVVLPEILDNHQRGDGTCSDIAVQQIRALESTGLLREINTELHTKGKSPLQPLWSYGPSRTHFANPGDTHVWIGLAPQDTPKEQSVVADASFQEISTLEQSGYKPVRVVPESEVNIRYDRTSLAVPVGRYTEYNGRYDLDFDTSITLGISNDGSASYRLGFVKDTSTGEIRPLVGALLANNDPHATMPLYLRSTEGFINAHREDELTSGQRRDMLRLLEAATVMPVVGDQDMVRQLVNEGRVARS